ncbi:PilZ domain-containing protein [Desulfomonile tiedjei]|uniref:PilZ domain-containing protein n=1 Tax=Desulfomonile tiedjei (strain ATCC 49306 / DSM 6799 / DCB-1) TaxID=706587 RepID=I4C3U2_DESTA|nr:PilZ domain-containing protein [Desulfomonile tiedjei]AFM24233.1 PilZ domain-containing protein [Desulfomonile tiedjei DSM 6799]
MSIRKIKAREIMDDIKSGMTPDQLMEKYNISKKGIAKTIKQILDERSHVARTLAQDIQAGIKDSQLMEKYQLSSEGVRASLKVLLQENLLTADEIDRWRSRTEDSIPADRREAQRRPIGIAVPVQDSVNSRNKGTIKDVAENGLAVVGMDAVVGQMTQLAVLGDDLGLLDPFELKAECRWVATYLGRPVAGFKISEISEYDMYSLHAFLKTLDSESRKM